MIKESTRQKESLVFEGITSISAVLNGKYRKINKVIIDIDKCQKKRHEIDFLKRKSREESFQIEYKDSNYIDSLCVGNSHGGIIAICEERIIPPITELNSSKKGFYVMIDGIEDPYNFGYAIRSIYAAGADAIILPERNWTSAAGVVCRSSAGASELLPLYISNSEEACQFFKNNNIKIVAAGIRDSISAFDADLQLPLFLIVGGEKRGISSKTLAHCDTIVRLDYGRDFKGSLSAASAASILSYEILRQNRDIIK